MNYKKILYWISLLLLITLSLIPRATEVTNKNYVFGFDQGRDYLDVQKIVDKGKLTLIGTEIGAGAAGFKFIFHGPGYYYLLTIPYLLFRGDPYGGVVLMFILGIASLGLAFFAGNKIFGKNGGLYLTLLLAISPPLISQSRFIWNSYPATFFIILVYYFIYRSGKDYKFIFLAGFFSAFIYNFELGMAVPLVISIIFFAVFILKIKKIRDYFILMVSFFIGFLPMFVFESRHGFLGLKGILNYLLFNKNGKSLLSFFQDDFGHANAFMFNFRDAFPQLNFDFAVIGLGAILGISLFILLKRETVVEVKNFLIYIISLPFITYFVFSFLKNSVWQHYLNHLLIGYLFMFTYVLISACKKGIILKYFFAFFLIIFLYKGAINAKNTFFQDYSNYYGGSAKIKGKTDALDYIYKDAKGEKFGLFVFAPPIYTYPFDYLRVWYGQNKYNYQPHSEKKGLFYLIIEKDGERPWADKGWMETVIKTGKILDTKVLSPSTFIIQKRYQEN